MAFWSPLSLVEFQADIRQDMTSLPKPKDVRLYYNYSDVPYNPLKSAISLFLAEFLASSLKDESQNIPLYYYLETSMQFLDSVSSTSAIANFHLIFLLKFSRFIGVLPNLDIPSPGIRSSSPLFDLVSSTYTYNIPTHRHFLNIQEASLLPLLFRLDFSTMHLLKLTRQQRARFLEVMILYYSLHIPSFPELKSVGILHEIFS